VLGEGKIMKLSKKLIAVPAIALTAGLSLAACGSPSSSSGGGGNGGGNVGNPETATLAQICNSMVGRHVPNVLGEETSTTITAKVKVSQGTAPGEETPAERDTSGNPTSYCGFTYSTGQFQWRYISAYPNGSTGFSGS
jgi:hypothetical protein